mgnify:CR=1 FL=1
MNKRAEGQIQWTVSLVLIGLFIVAIIGFSIGFARDTNAPISVLQDSDLTGAYTNVTGNLEGFQGSSEDTYSSIINSTINPSSASGTTVTAGQFSITPSDLISVTRNTLRLGYAKIFGTDSGFAIFINTFIAMLIFITGLLIWKTWAGRQPD